MSMRDTELCSPCTVCNRMQSPLPLIPYLGTHTCRKNSAVPMRDTALCSPCTVCKRLRVPEIPLLTSWEGIGWESRYHCRGEVGGWMNGWVERVSFTCTQYAPTTSAE